MSNLKVVVVGSNGEVGKAICSLVEEKHDLFRVDLLFDRKSAPSYRFDVMHVNIPFSDDFVDIVVDYIKLFKPKLVLIESTVPVGTTFKVMASTKYGSVAHSPIRGVHSRMLQDLKRYVKFIGPTTESAGIQANTYYKSLGLKCCVCEDSKQTELFKLLNTSYYGILCAWSWHMWRICQMFGVDYDGMKEFIKTTNAFVPRPVMYPPLGGFGGHCVLENALLLQSQLSACFDSPDPMLDDILEIGKVHEAAG